MSAFVSPGHFGGFLTCDEENQTEQLYAVDRETSQVLTRTQSMHDNDEFDGPGWTLCDTVPGHAEWIGNYPAPQARAILDAHAAEAPDNLRAAPNARAANQLLPGSAAIIRQDRRLWAFMAAGKVRCSAATFAEAKEAAATWLKLDAERADDARNAQ